MKEHTDWRNLKGSFAWAFSFCLPSEGKTMGDMSGGELIIGGKSAPMDSFVLGNFHRPHLVTEVKGPGVRVSVIAWIDQSVVEKGELAERMALAGGYKWNKYEKELLSKLEKANRILEKFDEEFDEAGGRGKPIKLGSRGEEEHAKVRKSCAKFLLSCVKVKLEKGEKGEQGGRGLIGFWGDDGFEEAFHDVIDLSADSETEEYDGELV